MNGGLDRTVRVAGVLILMASLAFVAAVLGAIPALVAAPLLSAAAIRLWLHFELPSRPVWYPPLALAAAVALASVTVELTIRHDFATWFAPLLAAGAAALAFWLLERNRAQCTLCGRRLNSQSVVFRCPRCSMQVCDETCWNFDHRRCQLCLEQRVPILPIQDSWWMRTTGPRSPNGRCQVCLGTAEQVDLRACPHCRRLQCRDCWDFGNGECARCKTSLPDLPPALTMAVAETAESPASLMH